MNSFKIAVATVMCALVAVNALAAETVTRAPGGLAQTKSKDGVVWINGNTSLVREWVTVHDDSIPATILNTVGVRTSMNSKYNPEYRAVYNIEATQDLSAIEIRFLLFDIWGKPTGNLSATYVEDFPSQHTKILKGNWYASGHAAKEHYASIAYIARVRTKNGRVIEANTKTVLAEARKFSKKFSESDLEPQPSKE